MITKQQSIHAFKQKHTKIQDLHNDTNKFAHILYKFAPDILFNSENLFVKVFTNGLAIIVAKVVSANSYIEEYFDINNKRF